MDGRQWIPIVALMIVQPDIIAALPLASTFPILMRQGSRGPVHVPMIAYGTAWKKDQTAKLVSAALRVGYRGIDTANQPKHYNERGVGEALNEVIASGLLSREQVFLQTKFTPIAGQTDDETLPYRKDASLGEQVAQSLQSSLDHLGTSYIDSYVLHEQMADPDQMLAVWRAMEEAYDNGTVRLLGISNINADRLEFLLSHSRIKPTFVQNRCRGVDDWDIHVRHICDQNSITYQGFWLITGNRELLRHPDLTAGAAWHKRSPAQILLRFYTQDGMMVLSGSQKMDQAEMNLKLDFDLSSREIEAIRNLGLTAPLNSESKIEGEFWNGLDYPVNVLWRGHDGKETQSYLLAPNQTPNDSRNAAGSTYHNHEYVFRSAIDGELINFWKADRTLGWKQIVEVNRNVELKVVNTRPEKISLIEVGAPIRTLEPYNGNPLATDIVVYGTHDQQITVKGESGDIIQILKISSASGGAWQTLHIHPLSEHGDEL